MSGHHHFRIFRKLNRNIRFRSRFRFFRFVRRTLERSVDRSFEENGRRKVGEISVGRFAGSQAAVEAFSGRVGQFSDEVDRRNVFDVEVVLQSSHQPGDDN